MGDYGTIHVRIYLLNLASTSATLYLINLCTSSHCSLVKIMSLSTDRPPTIHPADSKQRRAPFERSDSILATLRVFMSGKSAV